MKRLATVLLAILLLHLTGASFAAADSLGVYHQGATVNLNGPAYDWWYGCSPTSAGMMMGYYDIHGYGGKSYANLVPNAVAESSTYPPSTSFATNTYQVNNIIASYGYVTDYYRFANGTPNYTYGGSGAYNISGDDAATPTHAANCLADFMWSGMDAAENVNGGTSFYFFPSGAKLYASYAYNNDLQDGMLGMDLYFRYCGYGSGNIANDHTFFTQLIYSPSAPLGFTFANYKAEIDAGRVLMIQVEGHSMFGYGYVDNGSGQQYILFHDTWDDGGHEMLWGGSYEGMAQWGVVGFIPTGGSTVPLPAAVWLLGSGLAGLFGLRRLNQS